MASQSSGRLLTGVALAAGAGAGFMDYAPDGPPSGPAVPAAEVKSTTQASSTVTPASAEPTLASIVNASSTVTNATASPVSVDVSLENSRIGLAVSTLPTYIVTTDGAEHAYAGKVLADMANSAWHGNEREFKAGYEDFVSKVVDTSHAAVHSGEVADQVDQVRGLAYLGAGGGGAITITANTGFQFDGVRGLAEERIGTLAGDGRQLYSFTALAGAGLVNK